MSTFGEAKQLLMEREKTGNSPALDYGVETFCKEYNKTRDASDAAASLVFHLAFTLWGEVGGYSGTSIGPLTS